MRSRSAGRIVCLVLLAGLAAARCGDAPGAPSPALALAVTPNPARFSLLPPRVPPGTPLPECCATIVARFTLSVSPTVTGNLDSLVMSAHVASTGTLAASDDYGPEEIVAKQGTARIQGGSTTHLEFQIIRLAVLPLPDDAVLTLRVEAQFKTPAGLPLVGRIELPLLPVSAP